MAKELARLLLRIEADTSRLKRELKIAEGAVEKSGGRMAGAFRRADRAAEGLKRTIFSLRAGVGLLAVGGALVFGLRAAARRIAEFGEAISELEAIARPTAKQLSELERRARELGSTTVFSANEAAQGMVFLARAGFEVEEILAAIGPALNLAAAGGLELAEAGDIVSNVLQAFQRSASETVRFVDVLAKTAASANTDIAQLGEAMKSAAPVANAFGISVEQASAAIAVLSNAGLQGQLAGTGLRRVITELASPTERLEGFLRGASLEANGFVGVMRRLAESSMSGANAMEIFGQRGGPAFLVLREGAADLEEFVRTLEDAGGTAQRIADTRLDNLAGSFRLVESAINELVLTLGEGGLTQFLRDIADEITRIAQSGEAVELMREMGKTFKFIVDNRRPILATLAGLVALNAVGRVNPLAGLFAGLVAGGAAFVALGDDIVAAEVAAARLADRIEELADIKDRLAGELGPGLRDVLVGELDRLEVEIRELKLAIAAASKAVTPSGQRAAAAVLPATPVAAAADDKDIIRPASEKEFKTAMRERARFARLVAGALREAGGAAGVFRDRLAELSKAFDAGGISQGDLNIAVAQASAEFIKAAEAAEKLALGNIEVSDSFDDLATAGAGAMDELIDAVEGFGREFSRTMAQAFVTGDLTFKALGQSFLVNFLEKIIHARITEPLFTFAEAFLLNAFAPSTAGASTALSVSGPRLQFARGGVVESPTLIKLAHGAGLMGEAGPEAILPLARLPGGDLGVKASGGGVTVTIINNTGAQVETRQSRSGNQGRDIEIIIGRLVGRDIRSGGEAFRAVRETFNLLPATATR